MFFLNYFIEKTAIKSDSYQIRPSEGGVKRLFYFPLYTLMKKKKRKKKKKKKKRKTDIQTIRNLELNKYKYLKLISGQKRFIPNIAMHFKEGNDFHSKILFINSF